MKITELSIRYPVGTILLIFMIAVLGFISIPNIPVSFWPEFVAPALIVMAPYPGVGPEEIEEQVAIPLEEELSTIDGLDEIETVCMEGLCRVTVRFGYGIDFEDIKVKVQERTNKARSRFPTGTLEPVVLQVQDFLPPGIELGFYSEQMSLNEIRDYIETRLKNRFLRLEDVATVQTFGGFEQHVNVRVDPGRLMAYGLTLQQINAALVSENMNIPAGKIQTRNRNYYIRSFGKYQELADIENIIVSANGTVPIYLKDVATVHLENKERDTISRLNGKEVVGLAIREKSGGNTVAMCDEVKEQLESIRKILPVNLQVKIIRDQSTFIKNSIQNVVSNAAIGAVLAGIIILLFLGNIQNTLIIVLSIPVSIIATMIFIDKLGLTINTISLGGLALGVGMIVDASIVVLENIYRHLQENKIKDRAGAVISATNEVGIAITSSTLTSVVVFLPMAFLVGLFAVLLGELAVTVVISLSMSIIVALTIVPMLSYKLMRIQSKYSILVTKWQGLFNYVLDLYRKSVWLALHHPILTIFLSVCLLVASFIFIIPLLDVELLPSINAGEFRIEMTLPESTRLEITDSLSQIIEKSMQETPEIEQVYTVIGLQSVRGELKPNYATITLNLKLQFNPQMAEIMNRSREMWSSLPGARIVVRQTDVTEGMRQDPVNVRVAGDDLKLLGTIGDKIYERIEKIPGVVNINNSLQKGLYEFVVHIDRARASDLGLTSSQISSTLRIAVLGSSNTRLSSFGEEYDITLKLDEEKARTFNDLLDLPLVSVKGKIIPLHAVADISLERGPNEIKRYDQQRVVEIKADVSGRSQRTVVTEVKNDLANVDLPSNYSISYGGQSSAITDSFSSLLMALVIAIILVYVVMGSQFNSFLHPFTISMTIPLGLIGVLLGLWVFGASISMNALLGVIMLVGIVVNNGILLIDYIQQLRQHGLEKNEAIIEAGATRLRPILITSLTTIFGMLPIALGLGEGGEALQPLGAVVAGGLTTSTFLTLIVLPCIYTLMDRISGFKGVKLPDEIKE